MNDCGAQAEGGGPKAFAARNVGKNSGPLIAEHHMCDTGAPMSVGPSACYTVAVSTSFVALAARLFLRLLEIVRSMIAPQLIHFHA